MTLLNRSIFVVVLIVLFPFCMASQISSNAFYTESTAYSSGDNDLIFFYNDISTAQLTAPASTGGTYTWYSYNASSGAFDVLEQSGGNILTNVAEKGYRVEVNDGAGIVDNYYCWNFVPDFSVDYIEVPEVSCSKITVKASSYTKDLIYYDYNVDGSPIYVDYGYVWTSDPSGPMDDVITSEAEITAPGVDTEYELTLGSKFAAGMTPTTASYTQEGVGVEAKFSYEIEGNADNEAADGSSPLVVRFTDESIGNISDWEWDFGGAGKGYEQNPIFTFQEAGDYEVVLVVTSEDLECTSESTETFTVYELVVQVPTAFTPFSSPGQNDEFRVLYRSVKKYSIVIYNRWGRKVYTSTDPAQGWDGRIGNQKAEPGVYFYKIEAEGYKDGETAKLQGAIHLIVTK